MAEVGQIQSEMCMLRWSERVTGLDEIRNEYVRGSLKVAEIADDA